MSNTFFFREARRAWLIPLITGASFTFAASDQSVLAQASSEEELITGGKCEGCARDQRNEPALPSFAEEEGVSHKFRE